MTVSGTIGWMAACALFAGGSSSMLLAGPYSKGLNDNTNVHDAPVPGFIGPHGAGKARLFTGEDPENPTHYLNPENRVNPLFFAWADSFHDYLRSDTSSAFSDPELALGPVTGDNFDVVSLGDRSAATGPVGTITLQFTTPIRNLSGADFVIFENGFVSKNNTGGAGIGGTFAELAYVEVSSDGVTFHRFSPESLTSAPMGAYASLDPTNVYNLAGKHGNNGGESWGTPFDIGQMELAEISYIRVVDIPGSGAFADHSGRPIYDPWVTTGSGGFDLEAVGSISTPVTFSAWPELQRLPIGRQGENDDPDGDGIPNLLEYAFCLDPANRDKPDAGWRHEVVNDGSSSFLEVVCTRDERLVDLTREMQVSLDFVQWTTIARSIGGQPFQAVPGFEPLVSESSISGIASVGVIREDRIRDTRPLGENTRRFYRLKVSRN